jgi:autotransporter translocation and assembly factor TamB
LRAVWRWARRIAIGTLAFALVAIVAVDVLLQTELGRELARAQIETRLQEKFSGRVTIGAFEGSLSGKIVLHDVAIQDPAGRPALVVKRLRFELAPLSLLSRRARITGLEVDGASVSVQRDWSGKIVIAHFVPKLDWSIEIPDARIRGAHVDVTYGGERVDLDAVDVVASVRVPENAPLEVSVAVRGDLRQRAVSFGIEAALRSWIDVIEVPYARGHLGDVRLAAQGLRISPASLLHGASYAGVIAVTAPRAAVARLVPELAPPVDLAVSATITQHATTTRLAVAGLIDREPVVGTIDVIANRARGWLSANRLDVGVWTRNRVCGAGTMSAVFDLEAPTLDWPTGTIRVFGTGDFERARHASFAIALRSERAGVVTAHANAATPHGHVHATAELHRSGAALLLDRGTMTATGDLIATGMPIAGTLDVELAASGALWPALELAVRGTIDGERLRARDVTVESLRVAIDGRATRHRVHGRAELTAREVGRDQLSLRELAVTAANDTDGTVHIAVRAQPAQAGLRIEGNATVNPTSRRLTGALAITGAGFGAIRASGDLQTPKDLTDLRAWQALRRSAIRTARVKLAGVELAALARLAGLAGPHAGRLDGEVTLARAAITGELSLTDAVAPAFRGHGPLTTTIRLSQPAPHELTSTITARFGAITGIEGAVTVTLPDRLIDATSIRRSAILEASGRLADLAIDPGLLARFGVDANLRGSVSGSVVVARAARSATLSIALRQLHGALIAEPIDADVATTIDDSSLRGRVAIRTVRGPLAGIEGKIGITIAQLAANPRVVLGASLDAVATLSPAPASQLLAVLGRSDVKAGTLAGEVVIAGTVGVPTLRAHVTGSGLRGRGVIEAALTIDATWDGRAGSLVIDGKQAAGTLHIAAAGSPWAPGAATVTIEATAFDLQPLLVFAPGAVGAARGQLDAKLSITGLDPRTAKIAGQLHVTGARIPIAPTVGTLRRATIDVVVRDRQLEVAVDGRLGGGTVKARGTIGLDGASPGGDLVVQLRKVSPIGALEPDVSADITTKLRRRGATWIADVVVENGYVAIPTQAREGLKPVGAPLDMTFGTGKQIRAPFTTKQPSQPLLIANVVVHAMRVVSTDVRSVVAGKLVVTTDGVTLGVTGTIDAERGDLELFGRRYHVERAAVRFDGSPDPVIDVRITHDFPDVTTVTQVHGRLTKPELTMSSNPGIYSQGQLLGFLLGGEPRDDPAGSLKDSASGAGSSLVGAKIGDYVRKALPIDLDVLRYETATSTSSGTITIGTWLTRRLFLGYRTRPAARPDENFAEGQVEYWLSRRLVVEGAGGDRGYSGLDLLWRKRY